MNSNNKIPKIIHQTWKNNDIPDFLKDFQSSWKKYNPNYEYRFWTDQDIDTFIKTKHKWFYPIFRGYNANIKRVDAFRYFLLYEFGGLYVDLDFECLKSFDSLMEKEKCFFGSEPPKHVKKWKVSGLLPCNALMASIPKHPFWNFVCHQLTKTAKDNNIVKSTGPVFLRKCYYNWINKIEYKNNNNMHIKCYNHKYFYPSIDIVYFYKKNPEKFSNENSKRLNNLYYDETFAVHHWSATYSSLKNKKRNYLTKLTNQKKNVKYPQVLSKESLKKIYFFDDPDNEENIKKFNNLNHKNNNNEKKIVYISNENQENQEIQEIQENQENEEKNHNKNEINIKKSILKKNNNENKKKEKKNVSISNENKLYIIPNSNKSNIELKYPLNLFNKKLQNKNNKKINIINVIIKNNKKTIKILSNKIRYKR